MEGVTSQLILDKMANKNKSMTEKDELIKWVEKNKPELLVMAGAGDIDALVSDVSKSVRHL
jgi:UDP-N-acetylmuramate--alanine ligase